MQPSVPGGIPGRLIREMLQFGLETAEKLPAILYRKIFYYIITENILYLLGLCYLSDTPLDSKPSSIQGKGNLLKCRYYSHLKVFSAHLPNCNSYTVADTISSLGHR